MTVSPLTVTAHPEPPVVTLRLVGELDYETTALLTRAVDRELADGPERLRLNCAELTFCDTTGLSGLLDARRRAADAGCAFHLDERPPRLERLLVLTDTLRYLTGLTAVDEWAAAPGPDQARSDA